MAVNKLQLKRSAVAGKEPTTSSLALGELAINTYEGKVFLKKDNGVETIVQLADVSGSIFSASYAQTSSHSNNFTVTGPVNVYGSQYISGSLVVGNDITARRLVVQTITSSVIYSSGSNVFGDATSDTQTFTGSVNISGSLNLVGNQSINTGYRLDVDSINVNTITDRSGGRLTLGASTSSVSGFLTVNNSISASGKIEAVSFTGSFSGSINNLQGTATHIPYFSSSQVLANSAMYQVGSASIAINQDGVTTAAPEALYVWQPNTDSFNVISGKGNSDNYLQLNIQNTNQGVSASSDVVATANNGDENNNYINMGINSENFNGPIGEGNDAYLYSTGNNLHIGNTKVGKHLGFFVGGDDAETNKKLQLNPNNQHQMSGSLDASGSITATSFITRGATAAQFVKGDGSLDSTLYTSASVFNNTTSSLQAFSASMLAFTASTLVNSASFDTRINYISSSFNASTASFNAYSASMNAFSASMLSFTASQRNSNGTFATTGSNVFRGNQTITGSLSVSGSTNIFGTTNITGSVNVSGSTGTAITANVDTIVFTGSYAQLGNVNLSSSVDITGSLVVNGRNYINDSSSFDTRINYLSSSFNSSTASINSFTASMNAFSASMLSTTASMNAFSSSVLNFTSSTLVNSASFDTRIRYVSSSFEAATASLNLFSASMLSTTASVNAFSASMLSFTSSTLVNSASFDTRINYISSSLNAFSASILDTTASLNAFSASVLNFTASTLVNSASFDTRINYISSSFEAATASLNLFSASVLSYTASNNATIAKLYAETSSLLANTASMNLFSASMLSYTASTNATIADILIETASLQAFTQSMQNFTASTLINSASFDTRINYLSSSFEANSASLNLFTASFNAFSSSILNTTASINAFSASMLSFTASQKDLNGTLATTGSNTFKGNQVISGSTSMTGSLSLTGSQNIIGNLTVTDTITAQRLVVQFITSSVAQITGSTKFGDEVTDTHQFTGSVSISGSLAVNGKDYITESGSFDKRINYISSSFEAATASLNLFSASILSYTASNNEFVADMLTETASLQASTASLNLFSSSILNFTASTLTNSASFDTRINYISSSFEAATSSLNAFSASILSYTASNNAFVADILTETASLQAATASLNLFSASILSYTASTNLTIADILVETASLQAATASLNLFSASMLSFTASTLVNSASFDTRIQYVSTSFEAHTASFNNFSSSILSTTASINNFSASVLNFTASTLVNSASFDTRINYISSSFEAAAASLNAFSASILSYTASNNAAIADILIETASLQAATASLQAATASLNLFSASMLSFTSSQKDLNGTFATTGSNIFRGNQTVTGSLFTSGSNTLVGSTTLTGSFNVTGSTVQTGNNTLIGNTILTGSINMSGSIGMVGSITASSDVNIGGVLKLNPTTDPGNFNETSSYLFTSASNTTTGFDLYYRQQNNLVKFKWLEGGISTGLLYGGTISYSGSTIFVKPGSGIINNNNASTGSEINPIFTYVKWSPYTASATYLTSSQNTYLYVDASGNIFQQTSFFNQTQYEQAIPLGRVTHPNYISITGVGSNVQTTYDSDTQQNDFIRAFGPIKVSGFSINAHTGSLGLGIGDGIAYNLGGFYSQDPNSPSHYESNGFATASIARAWRSGSGVYLDNNGGTFYNAVDPDYWDDGTGTLNTMSAGDWQIQRVFANPVTGRTVVYYGQNVYTTLLNALQYLATDSFTEGEFTAKSLVFVGYLVLKGQTNNLTDTVNNRIINAGIFRNIAGGSAGGGAVVQRLENLADVSVTTPSNGQALVYDGGNWINSNPLSSSYALSASYSATATSSSYALTASSADNFLVRGTLTAQTINVQTITSSVDFVTGSTRFGTLSSNTHQFTGSVSISGSLAVTNGVVNSLTSSYAVNADLLDGLDSSTFVLTGSFGAQTASFNAFSASILNYTASAKIDSGSVSTRLVNLEAFSSSLDATFATDADLNALSSSFIAYTASLNNFSASMLSFTASTLTNSASFDTRINYVSSSFEAATASLNNFSASILNYTSSNNAAIADILVETASLQAATASLNLFSASILNYTASNNATISQLYAETASILAHTASINAFSASINAYTSSNNATITSLYNATASLNAFSASMLSFTASQKNSNGTFATTGSNTFEGVQTINSNLVVTGSITAQTLVVQTITSSVDFVTGSTRFGTLLANTHQFTGSVSVTGSLAVNDSNVILTNQTASMSVATASYWSGSINNVLSASYALTASHATNVPETASFANNATSASYSLTASFALNVPQTASFALTASYWSGSINNALSSSYALTASHATNVPETASFANNATSASYALTASFALNVPQTASFALTASYWSGSIRNAVSAAFADIATSASYSATASYALFALNGGGGGGGGSVTTYQQVAQATTWSISHFLNTQTPVVQVYDDSFNTIIPTTISNPGAFQTFIYFEVSQSGYAVLTTGGGLSVTGSNVILNQTVASTTWSFNHDLKSQYPVFTIFDDNDDVIIPQRIHAATTASAEIYFSTPRTGKAVASLAGFQSLVSSSISSSFATNAANAANATNAQSASYAGNYLLTSSFNTFSGSFVTYSGSINNRVVALENFSSSLDATFATDADVNAVSASLNAYTASTNAFSASILAYTASNNATITKLYAETASILAYTASNNTTISALYAQSASLNAFSASILNFTSSYNTGSFTGSFVGTASFANSATTASYADNFTVAGTLTAQTLVIQTITSSVIYSSGSNKFGNDLSNTQQLTGSVTVTGSLAVNGSNVVLTNQTASMSVSTASFASTASFTPNAIVNAVLDTPLNDTIEFTLGNGTTSLVTINNVGTASLANTASFVQNAQTASYVLNAVSSSFAATASYALNAGGGGISAISIADEGILQGSASYFDFTGGGVSVVVASNTASFTITGGGGSGTQGLTTQFTQSSAAVSWSFTHNLNTRTPVVQVYDSGYNQITPQYISSSNANEVVIGFGIATTGYAVISTGGALVVTGSNVILNQTASATTWSFNHGLNQQYPVFQVFNTDDEVIVPERIKAVDSASALIYFPTPVAGKAVASFAGLSGSIGGGSGAGFPFSGSAVITGSFLVSGSSVDFTQVSSFTGNLTGTASYATFALTASTAPGYTVQFSQTASATTWSFTHNMGTRNPIVQVYDSTYKQIIPNDIVGIDGSTAEIRFDYAQSGFAVMSNGGGLYITGSTSTLIQTSAATTWSFNHRLNTKYPAFEVYDSNDFVIIPANIRAIDTDNAELHFASAQTGRAIANFSGINGLQDNAVSASYAASGSVFHTDKVVVDRSLMDYAQVNSSIVGSNNLFTQATGSYTAAFFKYTVASGSNARAGEVTAVWNGGTTEFMDVSTNDIGNTNAVTASVAIVSGEAQLNFQTNTSAWRIKSTATFI